MDGCRIRTEGDEVDMVENGKYHVLFEKNHQLYVDVDGTVIKFDNPFDGVPRTVNVNEVDGVKYIAGYEPKPRAVKKNTKKKGKKKEDK